MNERRTIILQEALRSMAFLGLMLFGGIRAVELFIPLSNTAFFALLLLPPLLYFPIGVYVRLKTGRAFMITTARGWRIGIGIAALLGLVLILVRMVSGSMSVPAAVLGAIILGGIVLVFFRSRWYEQNEQ